MGLGRFVHSIALVAIVFVRTSDALGVSPFDERESSVSAGAVIFDGAERHPDSDPEAFSDCGATTPHYLFPELCRLVLAGLYHDAEILYVTRGLEQITGLRRIGVNRCNVETSDPAGNSACLFRFTRVRPAVSTTPGGPALDVGAPVLVGP